MPASGRGGPQQEWVDNSAANPPPNPGATDYMPQGGGNPPTDTSPPSPGATDYAPPMPSLPTPPPPMPSPPNPGATDYAPPGGGTSNPPQDGTSLNPQRDMWGGFNPQQQQWLEQTYGISPTGQPNQGYDQSTWGNQQPPWWGQGGPQSYEQGYPGGWNGYGGGYQPGWGQPGYQASSWGYNQQPYGGGYLPQYGYGQQPYGGGYPPQQVYGQPQYQPSPWGYNPGYGQQQYGGGYPPQQQWNPLQASQQWYQQMYGGMQGGGNPPQQQQMQGGFPPTPYTNPQQMAGGGIYQQAQQQMNGANPPGPLGPNWFGTSKGPNAGVEGPMQQSGAIQQGSPPPNPNNPLGAMSTPPAPPVPQMSMGAPPWAAALTQGQNEAAFTGLGDALPMPAPQQWQNMLPTEKQAYLSVAQSQGLSPMDFMQSMQASQPEWGAMQPTAAYRSV